MSKGSIGDEFFYDTESMSFRLQQMGFFYGSYRKRLTPFQQWRDLLNPDEMMMDEVLYILLAWTTYGHSQTLGLPAALSKTWLADTDFWGCWVLENEPKLNTLGNWVCVETEPVWGNKRTCRHLTEAPDGFFEQTALLESIKLSDEEEIRAGISSPLRQIALPEKNITSLKQVLPKFTSNDYVQDKFGFYTTLKGFAASRRCVQLVKKVKFPIHLLDNLIIPVNVKKH